ncbi:MAG: LD-carboxypeptidase [Desulfobacteraceae bacterium]|nr:MAG: LD-carboxypeptidase [Desulfobacteraceae bacterium]
MLESKLVIKPPRLKRGDKIGVISPAGPVNESDLQPGLKILRSSGFEVHLGPHVYSSGAYLAGDDEVRLRDLHNMFRDPEIDAVFCARGGYGSPRLLDMIDYDLIKENPKILVGYSDITALLMAVHGKTGLITFHGPMVRELPKNKSRNWGSLLRLLSSSQSLKLGLTEKTALVPGSAKGPLIGGNLSLICNLLGTPFLPSLGGCILFIEERKEPIYRLDRMLNHLALSGELKRLSGLIAGQFEGCGDTAAINGLLMELVSDLEIPLATGLPVGHGPENIALPLGAVAVLDTNQMTLSITEACVM